MSEQLNSLPDEKRQILKQLSKSLIILAVLILVLIILIVGAVATNNKSPKGANTSEKIVKVETELSEEAKLGLKLFKTNCTICHAVNKKLIGPPLAGVTERREKEWLYKFIRNNVALRESGDELAIQVYEENNRSPMNAFLQLSNEDIDNILAYIEAKQD